MPSWHAGKLGKGSAECAEAVGWSAWQGVRHDAEQAAAVPMGRACCKHACGAETVAVCVGVTVMHDRPRDCACMAAPCDHVETCVLIEADGNGNRCTNSARPIP